MPEHAKEPPAELNPPPSGRRARSKHTARGGTRTTRLTVNLSAELLNRLRDAVYWTPPLTLARLVEQSLRYSLAQMEAINQTPFPPRAQELKAGRPRAEPRTGYRLFSTNPSVKPQETRRHLRQLLDAPREGAGQECSL